MALWRTETDCIICAQDYSPQIKRFVNEDTVLGGIVQGQSLNRFAYVNGNPVSMVDPLGLCGESAGGSSWYKDFTLGAVSGMDDSLFFGGAQAITGNRPNINSFSFQLGRIVGDIGSMFAGGGAVAGVLLVK